MEKFFSLRQKLSLRTQIVVIVFSVVTISCLVLGWLSYSTARKIIIKDAIKAVSIVSSSREEMLVEHLEAKALRWGAILELVENRCLSGTKSEVSSCTREIIRNHMAISQVEAINFSSENLEITVGVDPSEFAKLKLPKNKELAHFQRVGEDIKYTIQISSSSEKSRIALLFNSRDISKIFLRDSELGKSGETFLADRNGLFLTPPKYSTHAGHSHPIDARPMKKCLQKEDGEVIDPDYRGINVIHGYRYIEQLGGACIMAHIDQKEAFAPVNELLKEIILFVLVLLLISTIAAVMISTLFTRPINALSEKARRLEAGEFDVDIPSGGSVEFQSFVNAFKSMTKTLIEDINRRTEEKKILDEAIKSRDEFLSIASHELRTPLTSIKLQTQLTKRKIESKDKDAFNEEKITKFIMQLDKQIDRINRLVDDMLQLSRISQDKLTLDKDIFDLRELIEQVIQRLTPLFEQENIEVSLNSDDKVMVNLDQFRIEQVIINLLTNAIKYGGKKPIVVRILKNPKSVEIEIIDQGRGIAKEDFERIFERFERAISVEEVSGLGLGLYIVKKIVEMHGGKISVKSIIGEGSTFCISLPSCKMMAKTSH